jgi:hypothetical protein
MYIIMQSLVLFVVKALKGGNNDPHKKQQYQRFCRYHNFSLCRKMLFGVHIQVNPVIKYL